MTRNAFLTIGLASVILALAGCTPAVNDNGGSVAPQDANTAVVGVESEEEASLPARVEQTISQAVVVAPEPVAATTASAPAAEVAEPALESTEKPVVVAEELGAQEPSPEEPMANQPIPLSETATVDNTTKPGQEPKKPAEEKAATYTATVAIEGPGIATKYSVDVEVGATIEDLMKATAKQGLTYTAKSFGGLGAYVESIAGVDEGGGFYWVYLVNGAKAATGISGYVLEKGDDVTWRFEAQY